MVCADGEIFDFEALLFDLNHSFFFKFGTLKNSNKSKTNIRQSIYLDK